MEFTDREDGSLRVYTDGGCSGNPGPGGWAYVLLVGEISQEASGGAMDTTNNKMELTAVIQALKTIGDNPEWKTRKIGIYTDSQYVKNGITSWIYNWERNGWLTAAKKPVKNRELWIELKSSSEKLDLSWHWVKGHAGNPNNERCDQLVKGEMAKY